MPRLPNGAKAPAKKKKPAPKRKPVSKAPVKAAKKPSSPKGSLLKSSTYQVPKSLTKNTAANRAAGPVKEGQKLTAAEKRAYKEGTAKLSAKAKAALKRKPAKAKMGTKKSDWDRGIEAEDSISTWNQNIKKIIGR